MLVHADGRVRGSLAARLGARFGPVSCPQPCSSTWRGTFWAHYVASAVLGAGARAKARGDQGFSCVRCRALLFAISDHWSPIGDNMGRFCAQAVTWGPACVVGGRKTAFFACSAGPSTGSATGSGTDRRPGPSTGSGTGHRPGASTGSATAPPYNFSIYTFVSRFTKPRS